MMKNFLSILLVFTLLLSFVACSEKKGDSEKKEFVMGAWSGNTYSSTFSGVSVTLPNGWAPVTEEEKLEAMGLASKLFGDKVKLQTELLEQENIIDLIIKDPETNANITISFENLFLIDATDCTIKEFSDAVATKLNSTGKYSFGIYQNIKIAGEKYLLLPLEIESLNRSQDIYFRRIGDYIMAITVTKPLNMELLIEDYIEPLKKGSSTKV